MNSKFALVKVFICFVLLIIGVRYIYKFIVGTTIYYGDIYKIAVPLGWKNQKSPFNGLTVESNDSSLNSIAAITSNSSLQEFSKMRFELAKQLTESVHAIGQPRSIQLNEMYDAMYQDFDCLSGGERYYYRVYCINYNDTYVSLTFTTDWNAFQKRKLELNKIANSIEFL